MPRTSRITQVGKRRIELSNLEKVLWPEDGVLKAELVHYYLAMAPTILAHIKGRPLSLVRFPDGIHGESFFQKNRPRYCPEWLDHERIGDEGAEGKSVDYVLATDEASLVWLANHAAIELHHIHARRPHLDQPDYFVFDLDPPEGTPFPEVAALAFELKDHLDSFGYHTFCKTTGRKGIHVVAPLEPRYDSGTVFEAAKALAQPFVKARPGTTLEIRRDKRPDKVLIDVYRNRQAQTIVSAYSLRGSAGAPVSMPVTWEELEGLQDPREHNVHTAREKVLERGDPWEAMAAHAVRLHTDREAAPKEKRDPGESRTFKTPEQLQEYERRRSFGRSPEPAPGPEGGEGRAFVVHRHHASRLHYDLRLEQDGALKSWAIPKGLPPRPGVKRLAVNVEDHPLEYLTFEGEIPKGEYGAGPMWVYAIGTYEVTRDKKDASFYFRLQSKQLTAEYRLINTRGRDWLLERVDAPQVDWLQHPPGPMLAESRDEVPVGGDWLHEVKWDGIRATIAIDDGQVRIRTRPGRDVTAHFPELGRPEEELQANGALFDGEIVCLDGDGRPVFTDVMGRIHARGERAVEKARIAHPAVCYLFDCLYLDGRPIVDEPLERRRAWLADALRGPGGAYRLSQAFDDGEALFEAAKELGVEGIVAKKRDRRYIPGQRASSWLKVKVRRTAECLIVGYTRGKGDRSRSFGALHLAQPNGDGGALKYRGKVGGGFDDRLLAAVLAELRTLAEVERPVAERPPDDAETTWVEPRLFCEVQYASFANTGALREAVFLRLRPDLTDPSMEEEQP